MLATWATGFSGRQGFPEFDIVHKCAYSAAVAEDVEWDSRKAAANLKKHGVDFAGAATILTDDNAITIRADERGEERYVTIGMDDWRASWSSSTRGAAAARA